MDKRFTFLFLIFLLAFILFSTLVVFNKPLSRFTRADEESTEVSSEKSHINIWPLEVKADGKSESAIQLFLTAVNDAPIINKSVTMKTTLGQFKEIVQSKPENNNNKYYSFYLYSSISGSAIIEAEVDGKIIKSLNYINFVE